MLPGPSARRVVVLRALGMFMAAVAEQAVACSGPARCWVVHALVAEHTPYLIHAVAAERALLVQSCCCCACSVTEHAAYSDSAAAGAAAVQFNLRVLAGLGLLRWSCFRFAVHTGATIPDWQSQDGRTGDSTTFILLPLLRLLHTRVLTQTSCCYGDQLPITSPGDQFTLSFCCRPVIAALPAVAEALR